MILTYEQIVSISQGVAYLDIILCKSYYVVEFYFWRDILCLQVK